MGLAAAGRLPGRMIPRDVAGHAGVGRPIMKKVVSGGPAHTVAFPQAVAGLPDTIPLN